jgi:hypothetical protein
LSFTVICIHHLSSYQSMFVILWTTFFSVVKYLACFAQRYAAL